MSSGGVYAIVPTIERPLARSCTPMFRIRTYNSISVKGLNRFDRARYEVASELPNPDAFLIRSQKLHDMAFPESLMAVGRAGAGVNNVPLDRCSDSGIAVFNAPGANANAVKELVLAGMLLGSRDIYAGMRFVETLTGQEGLDALLEKEKKRFAGTELIGKTLGVVGLGNIGSLVANMGLALGMKVIGYDPAISVEAAWRLSSDVEKMDNLSSLFARADYISLHLPVLDATRGLVSDGLLASVKPSLVLLNFARGEIVDNHALIRALDEGRLHRYLTDFPANDTLGHPKILQMPHIGASTGEAEENCAIMVADQLMDFLENGNISNSVNFPNIALPRATPVRLTISNRNVPKVLNQITAVIAEHEINIVDMLNKSREDVAYNIIDLDQCPHSASLDALRSINEVINLRVIGGS
jgi:D-3-phosphoglycerate dehydrogenase